jgi:hypothetical protein
VSTTTDLYDRLADALGGHDVHPADAFEIQQAYLAAGGPESATWEDLPEEIKQKVIEVEGSPSQAWDDPADVPDDPDQQ